MSMPNSITHPKKTPILEWCVVECRSKNGRQKIVCMKGDYSMCSEKFDHSKLKHQHNWGDL